MFFNTVYAQDAARAAAQGFLAKINDAILFPLITLMMVIALVVFLYGAFEYVKNAGSEEGRSKGKNHLIYGVIGMLVMLSALGILTIAANTFGLTGELDRAQKSTQFVTPTNVSLPTVGGEIDGPNVEGKIDVPTIGGQR